MATQCNGGSYKSCGLDAVSKGQIWNRDGRGIAIVRNWSTHYSISLQRDVLHIDCGVYKSHVTSFYIQARHESRYTQSDVHILQEKPWTHSIKVVYIIIMIARC